MNTQIYLWIEPLYRGLEKVKSKEYYYLTVAEDLSRFDKQEIEDRILQHYIGDVLSFADVQQNWDYGVVSHQLTDNKIGVIEALSPKQIKKQKDTEKLQKAVTVFVENKENVSLTLDNVIALDNGIIEVNYPQLKIKDSINFGRLWDTLENNILGKLKEGDNATIADDNGNVLFELKGGSFLSLVSPDIEVLNTKKLGGDEGFFSRLNALKGGVYIRKDGTLDIGDVNRTFYLNIHVGNLLKTSLKLGKSLSELTSGEEIKKLLK